MGVKNLLELRDRVLMLCSIVSEQGSELLLMDRLNIGRSYFSIGSLHLLLFDLPQAFLQVRNIACSREEHEEILIHVLESTIDIGCKLSDKLCLHIVFHSEESEPFSKIIDIVEGSLLF